MRFFFLPLCVLTLCLPSAQAAPEQTGRQLYELYCGACHGVDGIGAKSNPNPPLAGSEWLKGTADRATAAVLKGLVGPIEVKGEFYNLAMPAQGAIFDDEQLAKIITYISTSFGNTGGPTSAEQVKAVREKWADRAAPWTARELKAAYPIAYPQGFPRFENLIATVYHTKTEVMPDFSQLEPVSAEEEATNLINLDHADRRKEVAIVWTGDLVTDHGRWCTFSLNASDGARFYINDELKLEVKGVGPLGAERAVEKSFDVPNGEHTFRVEYFNNNSEQPGLVLKVRTGGKEFYLSESRLTTNPGRAPMPINAEKGRAAIYKNFIKGASPKAIGVGYGDGFNLAFSPEHLGPDLMWSGDFIDGGRHWTGRGQGFEPPAGSYVTQLLNGPAFSADSDVQTRFMGYKQAPSGQPTFWYRVGGAQVTDHFSPYKDGFLRTLTFEGNLPAGLSMNLISGKDLNLKERHTVENYNGVTISSLGQLNLNNSDGIKSVRLSLPEGTTQQQVLYKWKNK